MANHIVKHCILGLLKERTRIIVTENRTLYYYANQILHIENGTVSQSDFALGSFESDDYGDDEPENELNTNHNFVLGNESNERRDTDVSWSDLSCIIGFLMDVFVGSKRIWYTIVTCVNDLLEGMGSRTCGCCFLINYLNANIEEFV